MTGRDDVPDRDEMDIAEFLLARIAKDEEVAVEVARMEEGLFDSPPKPDHSLYAMYDGAEERPAVSMGRHRMLAECDAKRRIVEEAREQAPHLGSWGSVLEWLALPYADHPDYNPSWRP